MNYKKDFPIFENNPDIVFLDSWASSQKPKYVLDSVNSLYSQNYANIHRWVYDISKTAEDLYHKSKEKTAKFIWANSQREIIYTYNSTYAINLLSQSLKISNFLKKWDKILLLISEHHSNIAPFMILKEEIWVEVEFVELDENFDIDLEDFKKKYDDKVKLISFSHASNVTWTIHNIEAIRDLKREDTIFWIDASQSVPHFKVDANQLWVDYLFFTWHKVMAETWIWVLYVKEDLLRQLKSPFSWWWAVWMVWTDSYTQSSYPSNFEAWTPNIWWAISLLSAFEYIEKMGWYEKLEQVENYLIEQMLEWFSKIEWLNLLWKNSSEKRLWVFTFSIEWVHSNDLNDLLAEWWFCLRSWYHCTEPLIKYVWEKATLRASLYFYNDKEDIEKFFTYLKKSVEYLK